MMRVTGQQAFFAQLKDGLKDFEKECVREVQKATRVLIEELFKNTPVWSGETVRNYDAGVGRRPGGGSKGHLGPKPPPRPTSGLALGQEDNRPANESAARADVNSALDGMKTLSDVFVTNRIANQKWDLIDNGSAPTREMARNPGGVSILAMQSARNKLEHFK